MYGAHSVDVPRFHKGVDGIGHSPHHEVPVVQIEQPVVNEILQGLLVGEAFTGVDEHCFRKPVGPAELLEVEGVHFNLRHVADGERVDVLKLYAEQRAGEDIAVVSLLYEVLDVGEQVGALLNLVDDDDGLAGNEGVGRCDRHAEEEIVGARRLRERIPRPAVFDEIEGDDMVEVLPCELSREVTFSHLACSFYEKSLGRGGM